MEDLILLGIFLAILVLVLCFCAYNSKKSTSLKRGPENPWQDIPGQEYIPGEQLST